VTRAAERSRDALAELLSLVDASTAEREARLGELEVQDAELAGVVRELLASDAQGGGPLDGTPGELLAATPPDGGVETGAREGEVYGRWRVTALLGSGGMGEVYAAERADGQYEQRGALKLLRLGMGSEDVLRRFLRERQILARLEHPNIARLLDGGLAADGRPYFVLELVSGQPITEWCARRALPVARRLELLITCCEAVEVAHHNLVVHRDLKASNILVNESGEVKLLDFGIAKLLGAEEQAGDLTRADLRVLTPAYAAPEQILGGVVTTATDVYGLGIVLYELLTGKLPHDRRANSAAELASQVEAETVARPSAAVRAGAAPAHRERRRLARSLEGDLDTIVLRALHRDPRRRYASVAALGEDLRRHLDGKPVAARPDGIAYRARKFVERNWMGVAATALALSLLLAGLGAALFQAREARAQASRAEQAQRFLASVFLLADPDRAEGAELTARDLLDRGAARVDAELVGQPELHAEMLTLLGEVYAQLAVHPEAQGLFERALAIRERRLEDDDPELAASYRRLGTAHHRAAQYAQARPLLEHALALEERRGDPLATAATLNDLGILARAEGDLDEARRLLTRASELSSRHGPLDSPELGKHVNNLALVVWRQGNYGLAAKLFARALAIHRKNEGELSSLVAGTEDNLAMVLNQLGDREAARQHNERALSIFERLHDGPHPSVAITLNSAGYLAGKRGDGAAAVAFYQRALAVYEQTVGPEHPDVAHPLRNLGMQRATDGDPAAALALYQRALALRVKAYGSAHRDVASSLLDVAAAQRAMGQLAAAESTLRRSLDTYRRTVGSEHASTGSALLGLGEVLALRGRRAEAEPVLREALRVRRAALPAGDARIAAVETALAEVLATP
jgi:eukaryotic-like serine/threonine-protein kinase